MLIDEKLFKIPRDVAPLHRLPDDELRVSHQVDLIVVRHRHFSLQPGEHFMLLLTVNYNLLWRKIMTQLMFVAYFRLILDVMLQYNNRTVFVQFQTLLRLILQLMIKSCHYLDYCWLSYCLLLPTFFGQDLISQLSIKKRLVVYFHQLI